MGFMCSSVRWSIPRLLRSTGHSRFSQKHNQKIFLVCFCFCFVLFFFSSKFQICTPLRNDKNLIESVIEERKLMF